MPNNEHLLKQISSGQECNTLEIISVPDQQHSVGKSRQQRITPLFLISQSVERRMSWRNDGDGI
jgi:hypothetical protein